MDWVSINPSVEGDPPVIYDGEYLALSEARRRINAEIQGSAQAAYYSLEQIDHALLRAATHTAHLLKRLAALPSEERQTLEQTILQREREIAQRVRAAWKQTEVAPTAFLARWEHQSRLEKMRQAALYVSPEQREEQRKKQEAKEAKKAELARRATRKRERAALRAKERHQARERRVLGELASKGRPFFGWRTYIPDQANLTRLCLWILAPQNQGSECEEIAYHFEHYPKKPLPKGLAKILRQWVIGFQQGERRQQNFANQLHYRPVADDRHFLDSMFRLFAHQTSLSGRRVGTLDCAELSIVFQPIGNTGPSPFSKTWAKAHAQERRRMRYINHLLTEEP